MTEQIAGPAENGNRARRDQGGAAYPNRPRQSGSSGREVCFEEPEILVEFARELCKQIRSDRITEVIGLLDGRAQRVGVMSHVVHKELQHRQAVRSASFSPDLAAASRTVPLATPPSVVVRSAMESV